MKKLALIILILVTSCGCLCNEKDCTYIADVMGQTVICKQGQISNGGANLWECPGGAKYYAVTDVKQICKEKKN